MWGSECEAGSAQVESSGACDAVVKVELSSLRTHTHQILTQEHYRLRTTQSFNSAYMLSDNDVMPDRQA
jgi:hypothetical protein